MKGCQPALLRGRPQVVSPTTALKRACDSCLASRKPWPLPAHVMDAQQGGAGIRRCVVEAGGCGRGCGVQARDGVPAGQRITSATLLGLGSERGALRAPGPDSISADSITETSDCIGTAASAQG